MGFIKDLSMGFGVVAMLAVAALLVFGAGVLVVLMLPLALALLLPTLVAIIVLAIFGAVYWIGHLVNKW